MSLRFFQASYGEIEKSVYICKKTFPIMKHVNVGLLSLVSLPGALLAQEKGHETAQQARPNVVMIYADDLGYGDLGCYGAIGVETPNVDRLSCNGLRFTNAHAVASTSTPSRYSLLTGEYPWRKAGTDVAAGDAAMIISPDQYTVADVFKEAGYTTAAFGKWHLGLGAQTGKQDWNKPIAPALPDIGFDYSYIMAATADRVPCVFLENSTVANYDPSAPIYVNYNQNFEGEPTGRNNPELLYNLKSSHGHDYSIINGIGRIGYMKGGGKALWKDENIADSITAHAVDFIREYSDTPFFIYFATNDVHVPRFPHPRFRGKSSMGLRGDAIAQFDWSVGEIVRVLEEQGLLDNTLIILTSDNGPVLDDGYVDQAEELMGEHSPTGGLRGGKYSAYEGGTRVPFIVHWPAAIEESAVKGELVSQIDFLDVMAGVAGVAGGESLSPDGQPGQLATWLGREEGQSRPYAIGMAQNHTLTLRTPLWKYIEPKGGTAMIPWGPKIETGYSTSPQLFEYVDGEYDENRNKASEHPDVVSNLGDELEHIRNHTAGEVTILAEAGEVIDLTAYFGSLEGAGVSGDFIAGKVTDLSRVPIRSDATEGSHIGVLFMPDGTIRTFTVVTGSTYYGAYHIHYNGNPLFIAYNTTHDNSKNEGYKLISPDHSTPSAPGDEIVIVRPMDDGYTLSIQGKVLKEPKLSGWGHIMFSDNEAEAGKYLFEETAISDVYKIRCTSEGINYVNVYKEHGVVGNDKSTKADLATYTIEGVESLPVTLPASGTTTICFPFNVIIPEGICAYDAVAPNVVFDESIKAYTCTMSPIANSGETLKGGTPAVVNGSEGIVEFPITMVDNGAKNSLPKSLLKGNYVAQTLTQGGTTKKYILVSQNENMVFSVFDGTIDVKANQCWLEYDMTDVSKLVLYFDETVGIHGTPSMAQDNSMCIYNVAGQRLSKLQKGINIVGTKKVLVY